LAPERFTGSGSINFKSDVYGVGCVFYQILHARPPFRGSNYHSLAQHIQEDVPEFRADLPPDHLSFLLSTLEKDPQRRLAGMSRHRMFRETDWTLVGGRKGKGVRVDHVESGSVQINYEIDEDYNEETYPSRLIGQWEFGCEQPS
jgi:serine/threonine protein kinase